MEHQIISKTYWPTYFDLLSRVASGKRVQLEVIAMSIGDQIIANEVLFESAAYDSSRGVLSIQTLENDHTIVNPMNVVAQENGGLKSISIRCEDGQVQILHFHEPLLLGEPLC